MSTRRPRFAYLAFLALGYAALASAPALAACRPASCDLSCVSVGYAGGVCKAGACVCYDANNATSSSGNNSLVAQLAKHTQLDLTQPSERLVPMQAKLQPTAPSEAGRRD
jgi:hypothetical protein